MSALKRFFEEERARAKHTREFVIKQTIPEEEVYIVDQKKLDKAYETLKNWKIYLVEDLVYYYETLDQEEYEYILERKNDFPPEVQEILWGSSCVQKLSTNLKLKCENFTDKMYLESKAAEQQNIEKVVEEKLANFVVPLRPTDDIDDRLDELRDILQFQEQQLEKLMKAPTSKYVVPSMRKQAILSEPAVQEMMKNIETTKNEIVLCEKKIADADNGWTDLKRFELREKIIREMYAV